MNLGLLDWRINISGRGEDSLLDAWGWYTTLDRYKTPQDNKIHGLKLKRKSMYPLAEFRKGEVVQIWWPNVFPATVTILLGETRHNNLVELSRSS